MAERPLVLRYAARSDVGMIRAKNDDSAYAGHYLAVVADGMGGHAGGDVASASTVLDLIHLDRDGYRGDAGTFLADEIQTANSLLSELVHVNPKLAGMGTTVTALLLSGDRLEMAHIGDSRAYRLKNGVFEQISVDHTFVQRLIDEHRLRPEEAETHPHKNVLMRVLGDVDASPELDLTTFEAEPGERWLLCSDGLNFVRTSVIEDVVRGTPDLDACADKLIELTLAAGAPDNVTVVLFEVAEATGDDVQTASLRTVPVAGAAGAAPSLGATTTAAVTAGGHAPAGAGTTLPNEAGANTDGAPRTPDATPSNPDRAEPNRDPAAPAGSADPGHPGESGNPGESGEPDGDHQDLGAHLSAAVMREELAGRPHELVGAAVTALAEGKIPAIAGRPVTRRAATVLTHKPDSATELVPEEADPTVSLRRRRILGGIIGGVVLVVVVLGLVLGYAWTQTRYYVGESNGHVAVFAGVSQSLGPVQLSHLYRETDVRVSSLPEFSQQRVQQTVPAAGLADAEQIINDLQLGTQEHPCPPAPSPSATRTPTASPAASASASPAGASPSPSSSSKATAGGTSAPTSSPTPSSCTGGGQ